MSCERRGREPFGGAGGTPADRQAPAAAVGRVSRSERPARFPPLAPERWCAAVSGGDAKQAGQKLEVLLGGLLEPNAEAARNETRQALRHLVGAHDLDAHQEGLSLGDLDA